MHLEGDGCERRPHAAVEGGRALRRDDATEQPDRRGTADAAGAGGGLLQADSEGVEGVAGDDSRHPPDPSRHELPPPAARQELRPELHPPTTIRRQQNSNPSLSLSKCVIQLLMLSWRVLLLVRRSNNTERKGIRRKGWFICYQKCRPSLMTR